MKPLGWEFMINHGYEDIKDIQNYGSPSHVLRVPSKNGDIRNSFRNSCKKKQQLDVFGNENIGKKKKKIKRMIKNLQYS